MARESSLWVDQLEGRFDALIFDCDGTLIDNMPTHFVAWTRTLSRNGIALEESRFYALAGVPTHTIVGLLAEEAGVDVDALAVARERDALFHEIAEDVKPIAAVVDVARRHRGILPMAVASGSTWGIRLRRGLTGLPRSDSRTGSRCCRSRCTRPSLPTR